MLLPLAVREKAQAVRESLISPGVSTFRIDRAKVIIDEQVLFHEKVLHYIRTNVPEDERLFVGTLRHDRIVINDILFYSLSDRSSATK